MNQTLSKIEDLRRRIRDHEDDLDEYERIQEELAATEASIGRIGTELATVRRQFERVRILEQAWNGWITLGACREQWKSLPPIESFPEDGVQRIDKLCAERRSFSDQQTEAISQKTRDEASLSEIEVDQALLRAHDDVRRLERGLGLYEQSLQQRLSLQTERELAEETLGGLLRDLGEEWNEGRLAAFDLSVPVREEINRCRRALEEAKQGVHERQLQWDQEKKQLDDAIALEDGVRLYLEQLPKPPQRARFGGYSKTSLGQAELRECSQGSPHDRETV